MKKTFLMIVFLGYLIGLYAQNFDRLINRMVPNTVDIRSLGMGKAEIVNNSSNALFGNPSLLAFQKNGSLKLGGMFHFSFQKDDYQENFADGSNKGYGCKPGINFNYASASLPILVNQNSKPFSFAIGLGYQTAIDLSFSEYAITEFEMNGENIHQIEEIDKGHGGLKTITPGIALNFNQRILAGVSLNFGFGKTGVENISDKPELLGGKKTAEVTTSGKCFYPSFGLAAQALEKMVLGISFTPSYKWRWDEFKRTGNEISFYDYTLAKVTMPFRLSIGAQYQVRPKFLLAAEYQMHGYRLFALNDSVEGNHSWDYYIDYVDAMSLKTGHCFHFGSECVVGIIPLRFGMFIEPYPVSHREPGDSQDGGSGPLYMYGGTIGFEIPIASFVSIEFASQYGYIKSLFRGYFFAVQMMAPSEYKESNHLFRMDIGLNFNLGKNKK